MSTVLPDPRTVAAVLFSMLWDDAEQFGTTACGRAVWRQRGVLFKLDDELSRRHLTVEEVAVKLATPQPIKEVMAEQAAAVAANPAPSHPLPKVSVAAKRRADRALELLALLERIGPNDDRWSDRALDNCFEMGDGDEVVAVIVHRFDNEEAVRQLFKRVYVSRFVCWSLQPDCPQFPVITARKGGWRGTYEAHMRAQAGNGTMEMDFCIAA
jgi:hypothetical protein